MGVSLCRGTSANASWALARCARFTSLAEARQKADDARRILAQGLDPIDHRRAARQTEAAAAARLTTVREVARLFLAKNKSKWSNAKHRREWESSLDRFVHPLIGNVAADDLEVAHVLQSGRTDLAA